MSIQATGPGPLDTTVPIEVTHIIDTSDGYETVSVEIDDQPYDLQVGDAVALRDALSGVLSPES